VLRSLELLRSLPDVDASRITVLGKGTDGVNGMYAAVLDGKVSRVVLHSPWREARSVAVARDVRVLTRVFERPLTVNGRVWRDRRVAG
jgi:cephalosporin-C deacetylase-like acetyl esterase